MSSTTVRNPGIQLAKELHQKLEEALDGEIKEFSIQINRNNFYLEGVPKTGLECKTLQPCFWVIFRALPLQTQPSAQRHAARWLHQNRTWDGDAWHPSPSRYLLNQP